jgi:hypothetical protein
VRNIDKPENEKNASKVEVQNLSQGNANEMQNGVVRTNSVDINANDASNKANKISEAAEFICGICEEVFDSGDDLIQHMERHPLSKPSICGYDRVDNTGRDSQFKSSLCMEDKNYDTVDGIYSNKVEDNTSDKVEDIESDEMEVNDLDDAEDDYSDEESDEVEGDDSNNEEGKDMMGDDPDYVPLEDEKKKRQPRGKKCILCKPAKYFVNLPRHVRNMHHAVKCTTCDKFFKDRLKMRTHVMRVHAGKSFSCDLCGKSYTSRYQLRIHKETKHGDNASMCEVCGEVFFHLVNLKRHKKVHRGEEHKDFVCEVCGKSFAFHNKWRHIRTHTQTKAFKCPECDKSFNEKDQLNKHLRVHTGEKPYKCETCPKAFNHNVSLKAHMRKCH